MARRSCTFRQQDVTRALKASQAAGMKIGRVEIDKSGKIVLIAGGDAKPTEPEPNEWETK